MLMTSQWIFTSYNLPGYILNDVGIFLIKEPLKQGFIHKNRIKTCDKQNLSKFVMVYVIFIQLIWCFLSQLALTKGTQNTQLVELKSYSITSLKKSYTCINYPHFILCQSNLGEGRGGGQNLNLPPKQQFENRCCTRKYQYQFPKKFQRKYLSSND